MKRFVSEKIGGGKLLQVEVETQEGFAQSVRITGDFFLHPEDAVGDLEHALVGACWGDTDDFLVTKLEEIVLSKNAELVGFTCTDLVRLFKKAVGEGRE